MKNSEAVTGPERAGIREWVGLAVLAFPSLLVSIDVSVMLLALPHITAELGSRVNSIGRCNTFTEVLYGKAERLGCCSDWEAEDAFSGAAGYYSGGRTAVLAWRCRWADNGRCGYQLWHFGAGGIAAVQASWWHGPPQLVVTVGSLPLV